MTNARLVLKRFGVGLNNFANPFLENLRPCKTKDILIGLLIFLATFAILASLCTEALANGDAAVYIQQMQNLDFASRSVHIGYYLLGAGAIRIFPGSDDYVMNLMNCFLGALTVAILYFITYIICHEHIVALVSSLFLLTHYIFLENAVFAEVYIPQLCFLLLAFLLWLMDRPIIASLSFALSLLISTSAVFALPLFFISRPRLRPFLLFCAIILVIAVVVIFPFYKDYFFGGRGLFTIAFHQAFSLGFILCREAKEIFFNFFPFMPFIVAGLIELFAQKKFRPLAVAMLSLWLITLFFGEKNWNDFPVQFPTYVLLCLVGGLGFHLLLRISNNRQYAAALSAVILFFPIVVVILIKIIKAPAQISISLAHISECLPEWFLVAIVSYAVLCMLVAVLPVFRGLHPKVIIVGTVVFAVVISGFIAFSRLIIISRIHTEYRNSVVEMNKVAAPDDVVMGSWNRGILFEHYLSRKSFTPYWINIEWLDGNWGKDKQDESMTKLRQAIDAHRQIWVLGGYRVALATLQQNGYKITQFNSARFDPVTAIPIYVANAKE